MSNPNFAVKIEENTGKYAKFFNEISVKIAHDDHHWSVFSFSREQFRIFVEAIKDTEIYGFPIERGELNDD